MSYFAIESFVLGFACAILTVIIFYNRTRFLHTVWALFNISVGFWAFGALIVTLCKDPYSTLMTWRITEIGVAFLAVFFFHVTCELCELYPKKLLTAAYAQAIVFSILSLTSNNFFSGTKIVYGSIYYAVPGLYFYAFFVIWMALVGLSQYFLFTTYIKSQGFQQKQLLYFIAATVAGFSGGATNFFPHFGLKIVYPIGNTTIILYCVIVTYAILKYHLLDLKVAVTRVGIFLTLYALVLGIPFYVGFKTDSWIWSTTFAVCLATLGPLIYRSLRLKAEDLLLSEQRRYQKILIQAASGMTKEHNLERLLELIVRIVKKAVKMEYAAIFLEDNGIEAYRLRAVRSDTPLEGEIIFKYSDPLIQFMKIHKEPFLFEEIPPEIRKSMNFPLNISLFVPSFYDDSSIGFMMLGNKLNKKAYSIDDINVFKILSRQTSMSIENCIFVEEFKKAQERVFAAEKLASIGGLAEGVAHQINNRLNHFSMVSGELKFEVDSFLESHANLVEQNPELKKTFEYFIKISESLISNVKRTDGIVKGILNYAKVEAKETLYSNFFLQEVIDLSLDLLRIKHGIQDFPLELDKQSSDLIFGVKSQIMESVYNLLDNAYEATLDKINILTSEEISRYIPKINVSVSQKPERCVIQFSDNGIGIKQADQHKIFAPFFTTKASSKSGAGIGMYVVKRMVEENHKGKIWFESEYGKGTTVTVELPKKYSAGGI